MYNQSSMSLEYVFHGFKLIFRPGIRLYALIPIFINLILFILLASVLRHYFTDFLAWFDKQIPHWLQWLNILLKLFFWLIILLVWTYTFTFFANLLSAPFNGLLAEQVELYLLGKTETNPIKPLALLKDIPRSLGRQFRYLGYFLPRAFLILCLFFLPGGQLLVPPLWFIFNAWTMAIQYLDYPMDNHKVSFADMKQQLGAQRLTSLGFGASIVLLTMIPLVNLLVMPAAVAGATQLWLRNFKP